MDYIYEAYITEAVSLALESVANLVVKTAKRYNLDPTVKNFFKSRLVRMNNGSSISVEENVLEVFDKNQKSKGSFGRPKLDYHKAVELAANS